MHDKPGDNLIKIVRDVFLLDDKIANQILTTYDVNSLARQVHIRSKLAPVDAASQFSNR